MSPFHGPTFKSLFQKQIAELLDAEHQMIRDLPGMIHAASSQELKNAFELHLAETREQAARLEIILAELHGDAPEKFSDPMSALLASTRLLIASHASSPVLDAALTIAAQQIEHYEIASYSAARMLAGMLNLSRAAMLLAKSLKEEKDTVVDLGQILEVIVMGEELEDAILAEGIPA